MANDLLIKINADAKNANKAFDDLKKQTEDLEGTLNKVALVSGAAFAAFTAEIYFSVKAFEEAQQSSLQLTNALQNQGIYTEELKDSYNAYAKAVQAKTGIDDDAISKAQAVAQGYLGQTKITQELTSAIADLSVSMGGDLNAAAEKIAVTIGTGRNAFARQGLQIQDTATQAERYAKVLEFVQLKQGGLAEEMNKADGYAKALHTSFGNFQEAIGERFAPLIAAARKVMISFFDAFTNNKLLADLVVSLIAGGAAVTGIVAAVAAAIPIFLALSAAATALGLSLSVAFVGIPILIGAVIAAVTFLVLNWDKATAALSAAAKGAVTFISELFSSLGKILSGALTLDPSKIKEGLNQLSEAFKKSKDVAVATYTEITSVQNGEQEKQNAAKKAAADKEAAHERQHQENLRAIRKNEIELLVLQNQHASADLIEIKTKEIETLKALDQEKSDAELALLRARREEQLAREEQQKGEDLERAAAFGQAQATVKADLAAKGIEVENELRVEQLATLRATANSEAEIDRQLQETLLKQKIESRNQELLDRKRYGVAAATINKALNSDEVQGTKSATSELVQLQQSKNSTLKAIGKVAAIANITISTAESAMNIYRGFSAIPIVGPALGVIGAAAAVAFGAERIAGVTAAADGALVEGGIPGKDSVPFLLEPGELVVPKKNFNQVVGAVQSQNQGGVGDPEVLSTLKSIDAKFSAPQVTNINGDVTTDDAYIDTIVRKISDALEFRNARLFGVS